MTTNSLSMRWIDRSQPHQREWSPELTMQLSAIAFDGPQEDLLKIDMEEPAGGLNLQPQPSQAWWCSAAPLLYNRQSQELQASVVLTASTAYLCFQLHIANARLG